jgi:dienelactone hydrolase
LVFEWQEVTMKELLFTMLALMIPAVAAAGLHTEFVQYKDKDTVLEGYVAYNPEVKGKRPGVLVISDWSGLQDHYVKITNKLAELGYVGFAADIYGKGVRPTTPAQSAAEAKKYLSNRALMRQRALAGLAELRKNEKVDPQRIAAIGYCFGGTVVLELARSGADILGVVSFHGGLGTPAPEDAKNIKAKVLALHGADDPFVPPKQVAEFQEEMRKAGVDWQMVIYSDAVHAFTKRAAGTDKSKGAAYNELADKRSWKAMKVFLKEIFQESGKD